MTRGPNDRLGLEELQEQQAGWSAYNFGPRRNPLRAMLGVAEESGELATALVYGYFDDEEELLARHGTLLDLIRIVGRLAHAELKMAQRIRGDKRALRAAAVQEAQYLIRTYAAQVERDEREIGLDPVPHDGLAQAEKELYPENDLTPEQMKIEAADAIGDVAIYMADICNGIDASMQDAVESTWAQVQSRDWVRFPIDGRAA